MRQIILSFALLGLIAAGARADVFLGTSNPPGRSLTMSAGTTSSPLLINVSSNTSSDIMNSWMVTLMIRPEAGAKGTLTFQNPLAGPSNPANPPNYIFGGNGFGINASNPAPTPPGTTLEADDTDMNFPAGPTVPMSPAANLLAVQLLASANASGLFDIVAVGNGALTLWLDDTGSTRDLANAPDGANFVLGTVRVLPTASGVPEPSALTLFGLGAAGLVGWRWWRGYPSRFWRLVAAARVPAKVTCQAWHVTFRR